MLIIVMKQQLANTPIYNNQQQHTNIDQLKVSFSPTGIKSEPKNKHNAQAGTRNFSNNHESKINNTTKKHNRVTSNNTITIHKTN